MFMDDIQLRSVPGPSTRIDLTGVQFSAPAPGPVPVTVAPHLVVLVWNPPGGADTAALEVVFHGVDGSGDDPSAPVTVPDDEPLARNVQPLEIEPGRFNYRLVRADLPFDAYGTVVAYCRINNGPVHPVPYTLLPPVT
ncbi:MAG: hypothetical protein ACK5RL_13010 [Acidimicrobiales bacterium]